MGRRESAYRADSSIAVKVSSPVVVDLVPQLATPFRIALAARVGNGRPVGVASANSFCKLVPPRSVVKRVSSPPPRERALPDSHRLEFPIDIQ